MKIRKLGDKKPKVLLFQGSPRDKDTCPGMDSKTSTVIDYVVEKWSAFIDFKTIDLSVNQKKKSIIQPCKGCISTSGGFHCHYSCSCYFKGDSEKPDLLHDADVYELLRQCDAFLIFTPIHWHSASSQVKALFDRLVCANQTLSIEDAKKLMGKGIKDPKVTGKYCKSGRYDGMLRNHLEGKTCGFFAHGDDGANDYSKNPMPQSYDVMTDSFSTDPKSSVIPFVMQMKYSGVFVPDSLIQAFHINKGVDYSTANSNPNTELYQRADTLIEGLLEFLDNKDID